VVHEDSGQDWDDNFDAGPERNVEYSGPGVGGVE